jgi:hypothetical protein
VEGVEMKKYKLVTILAVAFSGGLLGGIISDRVFDNNIVSATENEPVKRVIKAHRIEIVDDHGVVQGYFDYDGKDTQLNLGKPGEGQIRLNSTMDGSMVRVSDPKGLKNIRLASLEDRTTIKFEYKLENTQFPVQRYGPVRIAFSVDNFDAVDWQFTHPWGCRPATISKRVGPYQHASFGLRPW